MPNYQGMIVRPRGKPERALVFVGSRYLEARPDLRDYGGDGFGWGSVSAESRALALAILAAHLADDGTAVMLAERFCREAIARIPADSRRWLLAGCEVDRWVEGPKEGRTGGDEVIVSDLTPEMLVEASV